MSAATKENTIKILAKYFSPLGIVFTDESQFPPWLREELIKGYLVELEHGSKFHTNINVTNDDASTTIKIAMAHLKESPDYYDRLEKLERESDAHWKSKPAELEEKESFVDDLIEKLK